MDRAISYKSAAYWMIPLQSSKWSAMPKSRADNGELGSHVGHRSLKWKHDSIENALYAVGMVCHVRHDSS